MPTPNSSESSSSQFSFSSCGEEMSPNVTAPTYTSNAENAFDATPRAHSSLTPEQIKWLYQGPPQGLPIRTRPLQPAFEALDAEYNMNEHPILDEDRMVRKGRFEVGAGESDKTKKEAANILRQHMKDRMPYVQLASRRLQAAMGMKNDVEFDLPNIQPSKLSPQFRSVIDPTEPSNKMGFFGGTSSAPPIVPQHEGHPRKDSGVGLGNDDKIDNNIDNGITSSFDNNNSHVGSEFMNVSPPMGNPIDPETGKGLREWLLRVGKENGTLKKKACKSISFHDCTPDIKSGKFENVLVRHYDDKKLGHRIDAYELDLPVPSKDPKTGKDIVINQSWIWFLISRPILSIDSHKEYTVSRDVGPYTWVTTESSSSNGNLTISEVSANDQTFGPPPNFPDPIPTSWMVFAAPISNLTVYPEVLDSSSEQGDDSEHPPAKRSNPFSKGKIVYKRKDYDFSHQGTPLFEFSIATAQILPTDPREPDQFKQGSFLSIENMPPFAGTPRQAHFNDDYHSFGGTIPADKYQWRSNEEYGRAVDIWDRIVQGSRMIQSAEQRREDEVECRLRETEFPSPYSGSWWKMFYGEIYKDEARWRRIKKAMAAGSCRVVVRWAEWEGEVDTMGPKRTGLGIGVAKGQGLGLLRARSGNFGSLGMSPAMRGGLGGIGGRMPPKGHGKGLARSKSTLSATTVPSPPFPTDPMIGYGQGKRSKL